MAVMHHNAADLLADLAAGARERVMAALAGAVLTDDARAALETLRAEHDALTAKLPMLEQAVLDAEQEYSRRDLAYRTARAALAFLPDAVTDVQRQEWYAHQVALNQAHDAVLSYSGQPDRARQNLAQTKQRLAELGAMIAELERVSVGDAAGVVLDVLRRAISPSER